MHEQSEWAVSIMIALNGKTTYLVIRGTLLSPMPETCHFRLPTTKVWIDGGSNLPTSSVCFEEIIFVVAKVVSWMLYFNFVVL